MASICVYNGGYIIYILSWVHTQLWIEAADEMKSSVFATVLALLLLALVEESVQQSDG